MKVLLFYKHIFARYKFRFILLGICLVFTAVLEGVGLGLFAPLIEYAEHRDLNSSKGKFALFFNFIEKFGIPINVEIFITIIFLIQALAIFMNFFTIVLSAYTFHPIVKDIRDISFSKVLNFPMQYFHKNSSGRFTHMNLSETDQVGLSIHQMVNIIMCVLFILIYLTGAFMLSWELTLLVFGVALLRYFIVGFFMKKLRQLGKAMTQTRANFQSYLVNIYQGIEVVKTSATQEQEQKRLGVFTEKIKSLYQQNNFFSSLTANLEQLTGYFLLCILIYLAIQVIELPFSSLGLLLYIVVRIIPKVAQINDSRIRFAEYTAGVLYLREIFDGTWTADKNQGTLHKKTFEKSIQLDSIHFQYPDHQLKALDQINLEIPKGQIVALVGESGSGKTTLSRLLLRLYEPNSGKISIDGTDINNISRESWSQLVSVISQDTFVFDDTIENNIRYSAPHCTEEEFKRAVSLARADEFIQRLPEKEKEIIGERGVKLSGGQRQRIAIARAFLRGSPILILDEATSALDSVTENLIQQALDELSKDKTLIVIAHRLATIQNANKIVVMDQGKIVETGKHEELLKQQGAYKHFYDLQFLQSGSD